MYSTKKVCAVLCCYYLLSISLLVSCEPCGGGPDRYKITSIASRIGNAVYDQGDLSLSEITNDSARFDAFAIQLTGEMQLYYSASHTKSFKALYACSPSDPTTDDVLHDITITADKYFTEEFPAGSNLAALFDVVVSDRYNGFPSEKYDLVEYLQTEPFVKDQVTLLLKSPPADNMVLAFTVKYYQEGVGLDYYTFTTDEVLIHM